MGEASRCIRRQRIFQFSILSLQSEKHPEQGASLCVVFQGCCRINDRLDFHGPRAECKWICVYIDVCAPWCVCARASVYVIVSASVDAVPCLPVCVRESLCECPCFLALARAPSLAFSVSVSPSLSRSLSLFLPLSLMVHSLAPFSVGSFELALDRHCRQWHQYPAT